jgi:hypothetical protein
MKNNIASAATAAAKVSPTEGNISLPATQPLSLGLSSVPARTADVVLADTASQPTGLTAKPAPDADEAPAADLAPIADTDLLEVKIDGEVQTFTIADARKALSGEGAIEVRLKAANDLRVASQAAHTQLLEEFSVAHTSLIEIVAGLDKVMFTPTATAPTRDLRQSDPEAYFTAHDAYTADQARVAAGRDAIRVLIQNQTDNMNSRITAYRTQQTAALHASIPALADPATAKSVLAKMKALAISHYGYSEQEIAVASDHRMYRMMYDLQILHDARKGSADAGGEIEVQANTRRIAALKATPAGRQTAVRRSAAATADLAKRAHASHDVNDIAAFIASK